MKEKPRQVVSGSGVPPEADGCPAPPEADDPPFMPTDRVNPVPTKAHDGVGTAFMAVRPFGQRFTLHTLGQG